MTRTILERALLIAVPFLIYGVYLLLMRFSPSTPQHRHPWTALFVAGLLLFGGSFIVWGLTGGEPTTGTYVAPHVVNGKVVPGYVKPAGE